jgi:hypothetical protein
MAAGIKIDPYQPIGVTPQAVPGGGYQQINAAIGDFGQSLGAGLEKLGQGAQQASNELAKYLQQKAARDSRRARSGCCCRRRCSAVGSRTRNLMTTIPAAGPQRHNRAIRSACSRARASARRTICGTCWRIARRGSATSSPGWTNRHQPADASAVSAEIASPCGCSYSCTASSDRSVKESRV